MYQKTIKKIISTKNIGLHSSEKVSLKMIPQPPNSGINFFRTDIEEGVRLNYKDIVQTPLCTRIQKDNFRLDTIEHLMAALSMMGIDNIMIEVDSYEIPIMDGSAMPFLYLLKESGVKNYSTLKKIIRIKEPVFTKQDDKFASVKPFNGFKIDYQIDFDHPLIKASNQKLSVDVLSPNIIKEISRARTFGFVKDVEYLKKNNLALGGSLDNAIILDDYKMVNSEELRFSDEFVRHKILDMIGDLYVNGYYFFGHFSAYKSGHALNSQLINEVFSNSENYEIIDYPIILEGEPEPLIELSKDGLIQY